MPAAYLTLRSAVLTILGLTVLLVVVSLVSVSLGASSVGISDVWAVVSGGQVDESVRTIVFQLRLPRLVLAIVVGAGLSIAGAALQSLLRNPLAEPYILGISSGGTVGVFASVALGLGFMPLVTPLMSFLGSGLVMVLVYALGHRRGTMDPNALLLSGVMVGAFFNAMILMAMAVFHQELHTAYLWLLGNLSSAEGPTIAVVGSLIITASVVLVFQSRALNVMATGEETARQFGIHVEFVRRTSYVLASLITGLAVSVSGVIGFVGLIVPHICRMLFGPDNRIVMPASLILGAVFLVVCDLLSRLILAPSEIPVGAITAVLGAPVFIYLLKRG